jgi:hypothetical protein
VIIAQFVTGIRRKLLFFTFLIYKLTIHCKKKWREKTPQIADTIPLRMKKGRRKDTGNKCKMINEYMYHK